MNIKILYYSRGGGNKKIAESIGKALSQTTEAVPPAYPIENVKVLFLGAGVYGGKLDSKMVDYIRTLDPKKVRNVALFSSTGSGSNAAIDAMKKLLTEKGLNVLDDSFACKGKYFLFFNMGKPNADDLSAAQTFAKKIVAALED